jgi:hypothetical protein
MKYLTARPNTTDGRLELVKGSTQPIRLNYKLNGATANMGDTQVIIRIRDEKDIEATPLLTLDSADSPSKITLGSVKPNIVIEPDEITELDEGVYYYDMAFVDSNGDKAYKIISTIKIVARNE